MYNETTSEERKEGTKKKVRKKEGERENSEKRVICSPLFSSSLSSLHSKENDFKRGENVIQNKYVTVLM